MVHEMIHLIERGHNERFRGILDRVMPGWRLRLEGLNRGVLGGGAVGWRRIGPMPKKRVA